ncbi:MAG: ABC transporter substrate-binding protein [Candidatus Diapherotrites archaeon]
MFKIRESAESHGRFTVQWMAEKGFKRVAVLLDNSNDSFVSVSKTVEAGIPRTGGSIVSVQSFQAGEKDFKTVISKLRESNPDIVYVVANSPEASLFLQQAKELDFNTTFFGAVSLDNADLIAQSKGAAEGFIVETNFDCAQNNPTVKAFCQAYSSKYGKEPQYYSAYWYDSINLLAKAVQECPAMEKECIRESLARTQDFPGVTGVISLDGNGAVKDKAFITKIVRNGKFELLEN